MTLDAAWDMMEDGFDHSEFARRPDDLEFRRVLLLMQQQDANLNIEGAIQTWQRRQSDPGKIHRRLKGHAVYRMKMLCSATDTSPETIALLHSFSEMHEEGQLPFHKSFMSSSVRTSVHKP